MNSHPSAIRSFGHALTLGTTDGWLDTAAIWSVRLSVPERAGLAFAALKSLDRDHAINTAQAALAGAGMPIAPLFNHLDEAASWADMAEAEELDAYCFASFRAMAPHRQRAFFDYVGRAAA